MILSRYIIREHSAPFFYALFVVTFIMVIDFIIHLLDSILSKGLDILTILELFALNMAHIVALSIPMSVLVASLMAFGRLSMENEITAMNAAGIRTSKLLMPVFILIFLLTCGLFYFNHFILPEANHKAHNLRRDISRKRPDLIIKEGYLVDDFPGYKFIIKKINTQTGRLYDIKIFKERKGMPPLLTIATEGALEYLNDGSLLRFSLFHGEFHSKDKDKDKVHFAGTFDTQYVFIENVDRDLKRSDFKARNDRELTGPQMYRQIRTWEDSKKTLFDKLAKTINLEKALTEASLFQVLDSQLTSKFKPDTLPELQRKRLDIATRRKLGSGIKQENHEIRQFHRTLNRIVRLDNRINQYFVEIHKKFSIPIACLVFFMVGAPIGIRSRKSGIGAGAAYSLFFFLLYWMCLMGGERLADRSLISPFLAMWLPNIVLFVLGIYLLKNINKTDNFWIVWWDKFKLFRQNKTFKKSIKTEGRT